MKNGCPNGLLEPPGLGLCIHMSAHRRDFEIPPKTKPSRINSMVEDLAFAIRSVTIRYPEVLHLIDKAHTMNSTLRSTCSSLGSPPLESMAYVLFQLMYIPRYAADLAKSPTILSSSCLLLLVSTTPSA
eukprot:TRINITY_DN68741_c0_g1_i1.p1 TRINITY_DN68741_c0_g1~~TRINITY_DN68741_c0_g1_i1.p1  ORF type:complete len:129 (+),score=0.85 TRINITY_DN68741_c0_g1_i1:30-416(+)